MVEITFRLLRRPELHASIQTLQLAFIIVGIHSQYQLNTQFSIV